MKTTIKITNEKKLSTMLEEAQKRASVRLIDEEDVRFCLGEAEERILIVSTKKDAIGTIVNCNYNAQKFPNAYKYMPESTNFTAEFTKSGWKILEVYRGRCNNTRVSIKFTEATKNNMAEFASVIKY